MHHLFAVAFFVLLTSGVASGADDLTGRVESSRAAAKAFGTDLKEELQRAMKSGGPVAGIAVCQKMAPEVAAATSEKQGMEIGRTSLKVRNPDNKPDDWELAALQQFERRRAAGEPGDTLEFHEVVEHEKGKTFRYMKAIPTAKVCLACHGDNIPREVQIKLDALYPDDAARGFKQGDLRGAFTISQPM
jgi:hypothetical protein